MGIQIDAGAWTALCLGDGATTSNVHQCPIAHMAQLEHDLQGFARCEPVKDMTVQMRRETPKQGSLERVHQDKTVHTWVPMEADQE